MKFLHKCLWVQSVKIFHPRLIQHRGKYDIRIYFDRWESLRFWLNSSYVANGNMKSPSTVNTFSSILLQKKKRLKGCLLSFLPIININQQYMSWKSDLHVHVLIRNYKKDFKMNFFKPPFSNFEIVFLHVSSNNWFRRVLDAKKYFWGY